VVLCEHLFDGMYFLLRDLLGKGKISALSKYPDIERYDIVRHFEFVPEKLRTASIVRRPKQQLVYLVKGSPETLIALCNQQTVPRDVVEQLANLTKRGVRVLAMARQQCDELTESQVLGMTQEQIEEMHGGLTFLGLLFLVNKLKDDSIPVCAGIERHPSRISYSEYTKSFLHG
jgi:magnesium-transporting ATPase (P-type)